MQNAWWYLVGDSPRGPVSVELLEAMLHEGEITSESLIWKEGLVDWIRVAQLPDHSHPIARPKSDADRPDLAIAGAWRRFFARLLDLWILTVLTGALAAFLLPRLWPEFAVWSEKPYAMSIGAFLLFPLLLMMEAGIFGYFGNTPGKGLFGITVLTLKGKHLTGMQYLRRQLGVFWWGFAIGLPAIWLLAMAAQGLSLRNGDPTAYDAGKYTVHARKPGGLQVLALLGVCGALVGLSLWLPDLAR